MKLLSKVCDKNRNGKTDVEKQLKKVLNESCRRHIMAEAMDVNQINVIALLV